jgi:hypothetical protein
VRWRRATDRNPGERPLIVRRTVFHGSFGGLFGFDLATGRPRLRVDPGDLPGAILGEVQHLATLRATVFCVADRRHVLAVRVPQD